MAETRECPFCKSQIRPDATVCPHCQRESEPWTLNDGHWWKKDESNEWEMVGAAKLTPLLSVARNGEQL